MAEEITSTSVWDIQPVLGFGVEFCIPGENYFSVSWEDRFFRIYLDGRFVLLPGISRHGILNVVGVESKPYFFTFVGNFHDPETGLCLGSASGPVCGYTPREECSGRWVRVGREGNLTAWKDAQTGRELLTRKKVGYLFRDQAFASVPGGNNIFVGRWHFLKRKSATWYRDLTGMNEKTPWNFGWVRIPGLDSVRLLGGLVSDNKLYLLGINRLQQTVLATSAL